MEVVLYGDGAGRAVACLQTDIVYLGQYHDHQDCQNAIITSISRAAYLKKNYCGWVVCECVGGNWMHLSHAAYVKIENLAEQLLCQYSDVEDLRPSHVTQYRAGYTGPAVMPGSSHVVDTAGHASTSQTAQSERMSQPELRTAVDTVMGPSGGLTMSTQPSSQFEEARGRALPISHSPDQFVYYHPVSIDRAASSQQTFVPGRSIQC